MKAFFVPISSAQFDQLFRFGELFVAKELFVPEDSHDRVSMKLLELFGQYLPFVYDEDYLVLRVDDISLLDQKFLPVRIQSVQEVLPLSQQGKEALTLRKNHHIRFSDPVFSVQQQEQLNRQFYHHEAHKGINSLRSVFYHNAPLAEWETLMIEEAIRAAVVFRQGTRIDRLPKESLLIDFVFTYVYQAYYPLSTIGYFFRTAEILVRKMLHSKGASFSVDQLESRGIYALLIEIARVDPELKFQKIIGRIEADENGKKFAAALTDSEKGIRYYIVIPLFLKLVEDFNERQSLGKTDLNNYIRTFSECYPAECKLLTIWLGAYLGYGNCYEFVYENLNLRVFKNYIPQPEGILSISQALQHEDNIEGRVEEKMVPAPEMPVVEVSTSVTQAQIIFETANDGRAESTSVAEETLNTDGVPGIHSETIFDKAYTVIENEPRDFPQSVVANEEVKLKKPAKKSVRKKKSAKPSEQLGEAIVDQNDTESALISIKTDDSGTTEAVAVMSERFEEPDAAGLQNNSALNSGEK